MLFQRICLPLQDPLLDSDTLPPEADPLAVKGEVDPEILRAVKSNPATDSVRKLLGRINEAVGGR